MDRWRSEILHTQEILSLDKYRKRRTDNRKQKLRELSQAVKNLVKRKHRDYLLKIQDSRDNPKLFWSYHKAVFHHRSTQLLHIISYKDKNQTTSSLQFLHDSIKI